MHAVYPPKLFKRHENYLTVDWVAGKVSYFKMTPKTKGDGEIAFVGSGDARRVVMEKTKVDVFSFSTAKIGKNPFMLPTTVKVLDAARRTGTTIVELPIECFDMWVAHASRPHGAALDRVPLHGILTPGFFRYLLCGYFVSCFTKKPSALRDHIRRALTTNTVISEPIEIVECAFAVLPLSVIAEWTEKKKMSPNACDLADIPVEELNWVDALGPENRKMFTRSGLGFKPDAFTRAVKYVIDPATGLVSDTVVRIESSVNLPPAVGPSVYGLGPDLAIIGAKIVIKTGTHTRSMDGPLLFTGPPVVLDFGKDHEWGGPKKSAAITAERIFAGITEAVNFVMNPANDGAGVTAKKNARPLKEVDEDGEDGDGEDDDEEVDDEVDDELGPKHGFQVGRIYDVLGIKTVAPIVRVPIDAEKREKKSRGKKPKEEYKDTTDDEEDTHPMDITEMDMRIQDLYNKIARLKLEGARKNSAEIKALDTELSKIKRHRAAMIIEVRKSETERFELGSPSPRGFKKPLEAVVKDRAFNKPVADPAKAQKMHERNAERKKLIRSKVDEEQARRSKEGKDRKRKAEEDAADEKDAKMRRAVDAQLAADSGAPPSGPAAIKSTPLSGPAAIKSPTDDTDYDT